LFSIKRTVFFIFLFAEAIYSAQSQSIGVPFSEIFPVQRSGFEGAMHCISQSNEGFMLFGNAHGILSFNALHWNSHEWTGRACFVRTHDGRVFAGGFNRLAEVEFVNNQLTLRSVIDSAKFGQITRIVEHQQRLYFTTSQNALYYVAENEVHKLLQDSAKIAIFSVQNMLFVKTPTKLMEIEDIQNSGAFVEKFFAGKPILDMIPFGNQFIVRTGTAFYKVTTAPLKIELFRTDIDHQLELFEYSCALALSNGTLCVGTRKNGLYIIDKHGMLLHNLTMRTGSLNNNMVLALFTDRANNLWVGQHNGVSRVEYPSAFSYFYKNSGVRGGVNSVLRFAGALYVATEFGVLQITDTHIRSIFPTFKLCNVLYTARNQLLAGTENGLFLLNDYRNPKKLIDDNIVAITYDPRTELFFAASPNTIYMYSHAQVAGFRNIGNFDVEFNTVAIDSVSNVWVGSNTGGVFRLRPNDNFQNLETYIKAPGLEKEYPWIQVYNTHLGVLFSCPGGLYRYNAKTDTFYKDTLIPIPAELQNYLISPIVEDAQKNLWLSFKSSKSLRNHLALARWTNNSYTVNSTYFNKIDAFWSNTMYPDLNSVLWFGGSEGLLRMDFNQLAMHPNVKRPLFFQITLNSDSVVPPTYFSGAEKLRIDYVYNTVQFDFAAPIFENRDKVRYVYFLDGYSKSWSEPAAQTSKTFYNLPAGNYTFRVKSIDVYGSESPESAFLFTIHSPHLLQWWTFVIYAILLLPVYFVLSRLVRWLKKIITRRLKEQNERLQQNYSRITKIIENMLPKQAIEELSTKGNVSPRTYTMVSILFCDIANFTQISEHIDSEGALIDKLNSFFTTFDAIIEKYRVEKIKTIGDAYMCAGGVPQENSTNAIETVLAALEMQAAIPAIQSSGGSTWQVRIGIHTGQVIAGVIGSKKYFYDIWGDSVNTASRMESSGKIGEINISYDSYLLIRDYFDCHYRGRIMAKNKGLLKMYFVKGIKAHLSDDPLRIQPNETFKAMLETMRYEDLKERIFSIYSTYNPEKENQRLFADIQVSNKQFAYYTYHNLVHVRDVVEQAETIGRNEGVSEDDLLILKLAALFHDIGLVHTYKNHEAHSVSIARSVLADARYTQQQIEKICTLIDATRMPQNPHGLLQKIMCDADLDYLGREDYFSRSRDLYDEFVAYANVERNEEDWLKLQIKFLQNHTFFTKSEQENREPVKQQHIVILQRLLEELG
jgi:class 3 adenylate cyclase/predicted metal-dependent HD superfamily phosphohydrolase